MLKIPLIVVNRRKPRNDCVEEALRNHFPDWENRLEVVKGIGHPRKLNLNSDRAVFFHAFSLEDSVARKLIRESIIFGKMPEPLRIAHTLAHGLSG